MTAEAESRTDDATARLHVWKETLDSSLKLVNNMFGTNITAELKIDKGGEELGTDESDSDRPGIVSES